MQKACSDGICGHTSARQHLADAAYLSLQSILHEGPACGRMMPETACFPLFDCLFFEPATLSEGA